MNRTILYTGNFNIVNMNASGKRVLANAKILVSLGYRVILLGVCPEDTDSLKLHDTKKKLFHGIETYYYPGFIFKKSRYNLRKMYGIYLEMVQQIEELDCVITYGTPSLYMLNEKIRRNCKKNGIRYIVDVVDLIYVKSGSLVFRIVKNVDTYYGKVIHNTSLQLFQKN